MKLVLAAGAFAGLAMAAAAVRAASEEPPCAGQPEATIATTGGAEDVVALRRPNGVTRLFMRDAGQISAADVEAVGAVAPPATLAWRPPTAAASWSCARSPRWPSPRS